MAKKYEKEYKRLLKNLREKIRYYKKAGIDFDIEIPKTPQRILKRDINFLKYASENLFQSALYIDTETGEAYIGEQAKQYYDEKIKKKRQKILKENKLKKKDIHMGESGQPVAFEYDEYTPFPSESIAIIDTYRTEVINRFPNSAKPVLDHLLKQTILEYGEDAVAEMLKKSADEGLVLTGEVAYSEQKLLWHISEMLQMLPDITREDKAFLMDSMERELEDWSANYDG